MATEDFDPFGNFHFTLEIDDIEVATFLEFSGLKSSAEVFEIQEGGLNAATHKLPGVSKYENFTLKYATSASTELAAWRDAYIEDEFGDRKDKSGAVIMRDNAGNEVRRYSFHMMWPVSWEGPQLQSSASALAIETLEIAYDGLYVDGGEPPAPPPDPPPPDPPPPDPEPVIMENIQFEYNSDQMTEEGEAACDRAADKVEKMDPKPTQMWVEGHTCTMGPFGYNLTLSAKRARATCKKMEEKTSDVKYTGVGLSWKYPVAPNGNEAGRAQNRRTEFHTSPPAERGRDVREPDEKPA
jgi:phage tail-like protein